jgi:hypothetical protein
MFGIPHQPSGGSSLFGTPKPSSSPVPAADPADRKAWSTVLARHKLLARAIELLIREISDVDDNSSASPRRIACTLVLDGLNDQMEAALTEVDIAAGTDSSQLKEYVMNLRSRNTRLSQYTCLRRSVRDGQRLERATVWSECAAKGVSVEGQQQEERGRPEGVPAPGGGGGEGVFCEAPAGA